MLRRLCLPLLLALACHRDGGGDPVESICAQYFACDCTPEAFVDAAECKTELEQELTDAKQAAADNGLAYDATCVQVAADIYRDTIQCDGLDVLATDEVLCGACTLVHGDKAAGDPCIELDYGSSCAKGLICVSGTCVDLCARQSEGQPCYDEAAQAQIGVCADGFFCDYLGSNACTPQAAQGDPCTGSSGCIEGLYCDIGGDATCKPPPKQGEACTFECAPGLSCDGGTCGPAPGEGQPCTGACAEGLYCDNSVCVAYGPLICEGFADQDAFK